MLNRCFGRLLPVVIFGLAALPVAALELALPPEAVMLRETSEDSTSHELPVGAWAGGSVPMRTVAGQVSRQAWRLGDTRLSTLQLMEQLAAQVEAAGYAPLLRCEAAACGGFDFRFALTVFPPPEMFVDLFDYRFLSAARGAGDGADYISLLVSRSGADIYLQITRIGPEKASDASADRPAPQIEAEQVMAVLASEGRMILSDLEFDTGNAGLGKGPFASLAALAAFLKADSGRRVALVGHSDTVGGYATNIALSQQRARAVMERLLQAYDVPQSQMEADGIAYLAPVASNASAQGREANRRVEAVLLTPE